MTVYVIVVESDDGYDSQIQAVYADAAKAEEEKDKLQSALGEDNVVVVEEHEVM